jgi:hypothetical protein
MSKSKVVAHLFDSDQNPICKRPRSMMHPGEWPPEYGANYTGKKIPCPECLKIAEKESPEFFKAYNEQESTRYSVLFVINDKMNINVCAADAREAVEQATSILTRGPLGPYIRAVAVDETEFVESNGVYRGEVCSKCDKCGRPTISNYPKEGTEGLEISPEEEPTFWCEECYQDYEEKEETE